MTHEDLPESSMKILMAVCAPKGREGGAAGIMMNYAEALEKRGHRVTSLFLEDLLSQGERTGRFAEMRFASRLARHIQVRPNEYSLVNLQAPAGFLYGLRRRFSAAPGPAYVTTLPGLQENVQIFKSLPPQGEATEGRVRAYLSWRYSSFQLSPFGILA